MRNYTKGSKFAKYCVRQPTGDIKPIIPVLSILTLISRQTIQIPIHPEETH